MPEDFREGLLVNYADMGEAMRRRGYAPRMLKTLWEPNPHPKALPLISHSVLRLER